MTLKEWMRLKGLKDAALAKAIEEQEGSPVLSRSQISRIRRGKSFPTAKTARVLERITTIPAASFVFGEAA